MITISALNQLVLAALTMTGAFVMPASQQISSVGSTTESPRPIATPQPAIALAPSPDPNPGPNPGPGLNPVPTAALQPPDSPTPAATPAAQAPAPTITPTPTPVPDPAPTPTINPYAALTSPTPLPSTTPTPKPQPTATLKPVAQPIADTLSKLLLYGSDATAFSPSVTRHLYQTTGLLALVGLLLIGSYLADRRRTSPANSAITKPPGSS
jgi:hypothetical protein